MSDHEISPGAVTLEQLAQQIGAVRAEAGRWLARAEALEAENARLGERLTRMERRRLVAAGPAASSSSVAGSVPAPTEDGADDQGSGEDRRLSRRGALRAFGGAAAGGVGLAFGGAVLGAQPAAASSGAMILGADNNAGTAFTSLFADVDGTDPVLTVSNSGDGPALVGEAGEPSDLYLDEYSGGVIGDTTSADAAVLGSNGSPTGHGVLGLSTGLSGISAPGRSGVLGECDGGFGIIGLSGAGTAVYGVAAGVSGLAGTRLAGVVGDTDGANTGVLGLSSEGSAVVGISGTDYGAVFEGGRAALFLVSTGTVGPPSGDGFHNSGEIVIDQTGTLFICTGAGLSPTWRRVAAAAPGYNGPATGSVGTAGSINFLSSPIRVFDSRTTGNPADSGRAAGTLTAGSVTTLQITGVSPGGSTIHVPAGAVGVIGNVTAEKPKDTGSLTLYPSGETMPGTVNLDYVKGKTEGNACVVALNSSGQIDIYVEATTNLVFDIAGFVF